MKKTYQHTFADGEKVTLAVDFSKTPPAFASDRDNMPKRYYSEYVEWVDKIVVPSVLSSINAEQFAAVAIKGYKLSKGIK